ncbi:MAG TPA: SRPBCC family protein [Candidatus Kapabacteria bacterium]|nr:SRPBCC family protein [Candidatus Kapabacteria bacterium]
MSTTTAKDTLTMTLASDTEIVITREFDAPRELVFKAMTDAEMIPKWWGPRMLRTVIETLEPRVGGKWRFLQYDPDGNEFAFNGIFKEFDPPSKLVMTLEFEPQAGHIITNATTLENISGKTKMTVISTFASKADRDGMLEQGMEWGMREGYERLDEVLAEY